MQQATFAVDPLSHEEALPLSEAIPSSARRDRSIDVLRGWAIVLMIVSHVGSKSRVGALLHLPLWISATVPFVLLSGVVLGLRSRRGANVMQLLRRAFHLWVIHCLLMLVAVAVHETTGVLHVADVAVIGGWWAVSWKIPLLRFQSADYMNILPMFVLFVPAGACALTLLRRGWTVVPSLVSLVLWLISQVFPGWLRLTDPACGAEIFNVAAWQFPFIVGLTAGYHRTWLSGFLWPRIRTWVLPALVAFAGVSFVVAQLQRAMFEPLHLRLPEAALWAFEKTTWGPAMGAYSVALLLLAYLFLNRTLRRDGTAFDRIGIVALESLGQRSLYSFLIHLPIAIVASALIVHEWPRWSQDIASVVAVVAVYVAGHYGLLRRYVPN